MNIKTWYLKAYSDDYEVASEMNENATFEGLFETLDRYKDVYEYIFDNDYSDSVVRERVFTELARIMDVDYNEVYEQWLLGVAR